jgi:putative endonuclease
MDWSGWDELLKSLGALLGVAASAFYGAARLVSELRRLAERRRGSALRREGISGTLRGVMRGLDPRIQAGKAADSRDCRHLGARIKSGRDERGNVGRRFDAGCRVDGRRLMKGGHVYIMTNKRDGTLYVGVTADLARRAFEHREGLIDGFTKQYGLKRLVYYEFHEDIYTAIQREKTIKHWSRLWKLALIQEMNPDWADLYETLNS